MLDAAKWLGQYVGEHFGCRAVVYRDTHGLHINANVVKSNIDVLAAVTGHRRLRTGQPVRSLPFTDNSEGQCPARCKHYKEEGND